MFPSPAYPHPIRNFPYSCCHLHPQERVSQATQSASSRLEARVAELEAQLKGTPEGGCA